MVDWAMSNHRLIGMIQPEPEDAMTNPRWPVLVAQGRITSYNETEDGRLLVRLTGVCRFEVVREELEMETPFRQ